MKFPKPDLAKERRKKKATNERRARAFRDAVWRASGNRCRYCRLMVVRSNGVDPDSFWVGDVHHVKPRSTSPQEKYNAANGVILCRRCHTMLTPNELKQLWRDHV